MLETIRESRDYRAPLPPRARTFDMPPARPSEAAAHYGGDQDPTDEAGLEYARSYHSMQLKAQKASQQTSPKATGGSPNSIASDQSFVSASTEPLYGDPGEEEFFNQKG